MLAGALLGALEKYQGAQQAMDGYYSLAHAREIQVYSDLLADHLGPPPAQAGGGGGAS